jgi:hypothetical protein
VFFFADFGAASFVSGSSATAFAESFPLVLDVRSAPDAAEAFLLLDFEAFSVLLVVAVLFVVTFRSVGFVPLSDKRSLGVATLV